MKKRCLSLLAVVAMLVSLCGVSASAADDQPMIDGSYLTHEEESIGYAIPVSRGEHLMTGYSKSTRLGAGILYAGGTTIAAHECEEVGVAVIVERAVQGDTAWSFYDSWQVVNNNATRAASGVRMEVEGEYYYRVRCTHWADGDVSSSETDGVFIESPW